MIFVLDRFETMVGVLSNEAPLACPYFDDLHIENLTTGVNTYDFSVPASHETAEAIEVNGYVIRKDLDAKLQMFKIINIEEVADSTSYIKLINAEHIATPELLGQIVRPQELLSRTVEQAMNVALIGTGWSLGDVEYAGIADIKFEDYISAKEAVLQIIKAFDVEIQYEVIFENGVVTDRLIHISKQLGTVTNKIFKYGKDLQDVKRTTNSENVVTAMIGVGKADDSGVRLNLIGFSTHDGQTPLPEGYVSDTSADFIYSEEALQEYGRNGKHIFGLFMDDNATNQETLFANTLAELQKRVVPENTYEMKIATLERVTGYENEKVRIGDTIIADDDTFVPRLVINARVIEVKRSYTAPENDELTFGDYRPIAITKYDSIEKLQKVISANEAKWNAASYEIRFSSTAGNAFKNGQGSTIVTALLFRNSIEYDADGTIYTYTWKKYDKDGNLLSETKGKSITVSASEITEKAVFKCSLEIEDSYY